VVLKSHFRGYEIELLEGQWIFSDTKKSVADTWQNRPCGHCGKHNTPEGHDACLGTLPGVINACCGHGHDKAYVQFENGIIIRGRIEK
jgi:hypothetical protein